MSFLAQTVKVNGLQHSFFFCGGGNHPAKNTLLLNDKNVILGTFRTFHLGYVNMRENIKGMLHCNVCNHH